MYAKRISVNGKEYMRAAEVAQILGYTEHWIRDLGRLGKLPSLKQSHVRWFNLAEVREKLGLEPDATATESWGTALSNATDRDRDKYAALRGI
jgi:hypothetical protein